jgi:DNA-binding Lrp family transcriptional regulator
MVEKLDLKDRKILYELDKNARTPSSVIARKVGLTPEGVNYRIKRFEEEGIITNYQMIVNLSKLSIFQFKIFLSFQHINSERINEIIELLKKKEYIKWIVSSRGEWDLIITIETDSVESADDIKIKILSLFGDYIRKKSLSILVEAETYNRVYLLDEKNVISSRAVMKKENLIDVDELDMKILKRLSENSRISIVDLADELKSTTRIIQYRIKQLEKQKVILGYKVALNYEKLGIKFYKCLVYLSNIKENRIKDLINYFVSNRNAIHNVQVMGDWDFEPEFEVFSEEEFEKILGEMKDKFSDIISRVDVVTIRKEYKFVYF